MIDKLFTMVNTRSIIALGLTAIFGYLACVGSLNELFMSVYTTVILFYFVDNARGGNNG